MRPKEERNEQIMLLRDKDPKKYSYRKLGEIFNLKCSTVFEIYNREKKRKGKTTVDKC